MFAVQRDTERRQRWLILTAGAGLGCTLFGVTLAWASLLPANTPPPASQVIRMSVVRTPPKAPPAAELPIPERPPKQEEPVLASRKPKPWKQPLNTQPDPPPQEEASPQPLALGITLSSTTSNTNGPRFAVGDSLMGTPDRVAQAPRKPRRVKRSARSAGPVQASGENGRSSHKQSVAAKLKSSVKPTYPASARALGREGVVVLAITIGPDGNVKTATVLKGLGSGLDASALNAARRTRWSPATLGGRAITSTRRFNVRFSLRS